MLSWCKLELLNSLLNDMNEKTWMRNQNEKSFMSQWESSFGEFTFNNFTIESLSLLSSLCSVKTCAGLKCCQTNEKLKHHDKNITNIANISRWIIKWTAVNKQKLAPSVIIHACALQSIWPTPKPQLSNGIMNTVFWMESWTTTLSLSTTRKVINMLKFISHKTMLPYRVWLYIRYF